MNNSSEGEKLFRAKKTTQNHDDFKVLMVGAVLTIILMLTIPVFSKFYDYNFADRPFVVATVEVVKVAEYEKPMILYDADAIRLVDATWTAIVRDAKMQRLSSRQGEGVYTDAVDNPRLWTWDAFFDNGSGSPAPLVPDQPFHVCVRYSSVTRISQVEDESPEVCSKLFDPNLGQIEIIDLTHQGVMP